MNRSTSILNTGSRINPARPDDAEYFDARLVAYVVRRNDKLSVITSFGSLSDAWQVGTIHEVHADQSRRRLGYAEVVGIKDFATGAAAGAVPNSKLSHWVFK